VKSSTAAGKVDKQLERYRSMRDFSITHEPARSVKATASRVKLPFVIQKHAASRLHYDFRLGWNGVLKSWAVAKGPSYYPKDKRLAVQVEDHPIEYGGFEGIIPQGQYGGGTVMLWDEGTWEPQAEYPDVDAGLRNGSLKFILHGEKLQGKWALVRMKDKVPNQKHNWLLIKEHDFFERGETDTPITEEAPNSVVTERTLEQIAHSEDHVWGSKKAAKKSAQKRDQPSLFPKRRLLQKESLKTSTPPTAKQQQSTQSLSSDLRSYPRESLPDFIAPQLAIQIDQAPVGEGWLHELKLDGYRIQAHKNGSSVHLYTRTGLDWTHRMKSTAEGVATLPVHSAILDGEVVVLSENGTTNFADLQASFSDGGKHSRTYFVFDLLHADGHNLRNAQLIERKQLLAEILANTPVGIGFSEHINANGASVFNRACELHAEGIVSKLAAGQYKSGRTSEWVKVKCVQEQEFVVGGFTLPSNGSLGIGALLLGYYEKGRLIYAGRTGTGFTQKSSRTLRDQADKLRTAKCHFQNVPRDAQKGVIWLKPTLVVQVRFATWTADCLVRQASFQGLREDKPAKDVRREIPVFLGRKSTTKEAHHAIRDASAATTLSPAPEKKAKRQSAIRLTHPDKVLDEESGLTKQQLADYYWQIADYLLPEITNRPLSLVRCPEGSGKPCFFQKHTSVMLPPGVETIDIRDKSGKVEPYITISTKEALAGLAQMGVLEVHPWGAQNTDLEHPDRMIIDLDPDASVTWRTLADSAKEVHALFRKFGVESFLKSTGGKGLHVVVPMDPKHSWQEIKNTAREIALYLERKQPSLYISKSSKAARSGRIFVDYLRNERGATAVAAFSPRARLGVNVAMPLSWSELDAKERPIFQVVDFETWKPRLRRSPWKKMPLIHQHIEMEILAKQLSD